jgi:hypothetical protein
MPMRSSSHSRQQPGHCSVNMIPRALVWALEHRGIPTAPTRLAVLWGSLMGFASNLRSSRLEWVMPRGHIISSRAVYDSETELCRPDRRGVSPIWAARRKPCSLLSKSAFRCVRKKPSWWMWWLRPVTLLGYERFVMLTYDSLISGSRLQRVRSANCKK